jgi:hypothetical protein
VVYLRLFYLHNQLTDNLLVNHFCLIVYKNDILIRFKLCCTIFFLFDKIFFESFTKIVFVDVYMNILFSNLLFRGYELSNISLFWPFIWITIDLTTPSDMCSFVTKYLWWNSYCNPLFWYNKGLVGICALVREYRLTWDV